MTQRWNPMRDVITLQERMNRLFEEAATRREEDTEATMERADWHPAADVFEYDKEYLILLDLPGIERQELDVSFDEDRLTIRGTRKAVVEEGAHQRRSERQVGRFLRSFTLPVVVNREAITADYKDGVLRLHLPKRIAESPQSRRVEIKVL